MDVRTTNVSFYVTEGIDFGFPQLEYKLQYKDEEGKIYTVFYLTERIEALFANNLSGFSKGCSIKILYNPKKPTWLFIDIPHYITTLKSQKKRDKEREKKNWY